MTHLLHEAFKETASTGTDELTSPGDTSTKRGLACDRACVTITAAVAPARDNNSSGSACSDNNSRGSARATTTAAVAPACDDNNSSGSARV